MSNKKNWHWICRGGFTRFHIQSLIGVRNCDVIGVMSRTRSSAEESASLARTIGVGDAKVYDTVTDMVMDANINALGYALQISLVLRSWKR